MKKKKKLRHWIFTCIFTGESLFDCGDEGIMENYRHKYFSVRNGLSYSIYLS